MRPSLSALSAVAEWVAALRPETGSQATYEALTLLRPPTPGSQGGKA